MTTNAAHRMRQVTLILSAAALLLCGCAASTVASRIVDSEDDSRLVSLQSSNGSTVRLSLSATSPLHVMEDSELELGSLSLSYDGADFDDSTRLEVSLDCNADAGDSGEFRFATRALKGIHFPSHEMRGDAGVLAMVGALTSLNSALEGLMFVPPRNFHGTLDIRPGLRCLDCESHDAQVHQSLSINVMNVDDPLHFLWDGAEFMDRQIILETDEDTILSFANSTSSLSLIDVDGDETSVEVIISSEHGQVCYLPQNTSDALYIRESDVIFDNLDKFFVCEESSKEGLTLNGTVKGINDVFGTLVYAPSPNWWGFDTMKFRAVGNNEISRELIIRVNAINDRPVLHLNGTYEGHVTSPNSWTNLTLTTIEDLTLEITAISVHDNDCRDRFVPRCILEVRVDAHNGTLSIDRRFSALPLDGGRSVVMRGTEADLNQALRTLTYAPSENFHGMDQLTATVVDFGLDDGDEQLAFTRHIVVNVFSSPDEPVISLPVGSAFLSAQEDVEGIIGGDCEAEGIDSARVMSCDSIELHHVDDEDFGDMNLTIACEHGMIRFDTNGTFAKTAELRADIDTLNTRIDGMAYRSDLNYNGMDKIVLSATSFSGMSSTSSILLVNVEAVNDAPVLVVSGEYHHESDRTGDGLSLKRTHCEPLIVLEDEPTRISSMHIRDVDVSPLNAFLEITIEALAGHVKVHKDAIIQKWVSDWDSRHEYQQKIRFQCNLENAEKALQQLWYRPPVNFAGGDSILVSVSDLGNVGASNGESFPLKDTATLPVTILEQEDHPSMSVPSQMQVHEDVQTVISPPVTVSHPDSVYEEIQLEIECNHGNVKLSSSHGLTLTHGTKGYGGHIAGFGTVKAWNRAFLNMTYTTKQDGVGADEILFSVANANSSPTNATHENYTMFVDVLPVNDAPEWIVPGRNLVLQNTGGYIVESVDRLFVDEDQELVLRSVRISDVDLNDKEGPRQTFVAVKLKSSSGTIKLSGTEGLYFFEGNDNSAFMHWKGTFQNSNAALSTITYRGLPNFHGDDALEFYVSDLGNIGAGGLLSSTIGIPITIAPVPDSPRLILPSFALVCGEEEWCSVPSVVINDPDNGDSALVRMEISVEKGRLSFDRMEFPSSVQFLEGTPLGDEFFRMSGPLIDMSSILEDLAYMGSVGTSNDVGTIHMVVWTGEAATTAFSPEYLTAVGQIHVMIVNSENNRPSINFAGAVYRDDDGCSVAAEDQPRSFKQASPFVRDNVKCRRLVDVAPFSCIEDTECRLGGISVSDPDSEVLEVSMKVNRGVLAMTNSSSANVLFLVGRSGPLPQRDVDLQEVQGSGLVVRGSVDSLNRALESLVYMGDKDWFGRDDLDIVVRDVSRGSSDYMHTAMKDTMSIMIQIASANDPPRLVGISDVLEVDEDSFLGIDGLKVLDVDTDFVGSSIEELIELRIAVRHGEVLLNSVADLNFTVPSIPEGEHSWFSLSPGAGIRKQHWWSDVVLRGKLRDINKSIEHLAFKPPANWNSRGNEFAEVMLEVMESRNSNVTDTIKVFIRVKAVNDPPEVTFHDNLTLGGDEKRLILVEDTSAQLRASVADGDDEVLEVEIAAHMGYASLPNRTIACYEECGDLDDVDYTAGQMAETIVFQGTIDAINAKLGRVEFMPSPNFNGEAALVITARDAHGGEGRNELNITIAPADDAVVLWTPIEVSGSAPLIILDDGDRIKVGVGWYPSDFVLMNSRIEDISSRPEVGTSKFREMDVERAFYISDEDDVDGETYHVELSVSLGSIILDNTAACALSFHNGVNAGMSVRFLGALECINNHVFRHIVYVADKGENGSTELKIKVGQKCARWDQDGSDGMSLITGSARCDEQFDVPAAEGSISIYVVAVNSPPSIRWLGVEATVQVRLDERNQAIGGFSVEDNDILENSLMDSFARKAEGVMSVIVSVTTGVISLHSRDGLTFLRGNGVNDRTVELQGALQDINVALKVIYFSCLSDDGCKEGMVELTLLVDDNGFSGKGGPKQDSAVIAIEVQL